MDLDSRSEGEPARYLTAEALRRGLASLPPAPKDLGRLMHVVARGDGGRRRAPSRIVLSIEEGLTGDAWSRRVDRKLDAQVTVIQAGVAGLIANGQPLELFGDNLFVDLDLSSANLPAGSQVAIGEVLLEVTPLPHNGCRKFRTRFGEDALRFVQDAVTRHRNMRGIHARVVRSGEAAVGDQVEVVRRG